jgi:hypothetical protein
MQHTVLATIRNLDDLPLAEFVASQGPEDLRIELALLPHGEAYRDVLTPLLGGDIRLLMNGTLYVTTSEAQPLQDVAEVLGQASFSQLKLAYNRAGIDQAYEMIRQIAMNQAASVPFSDLLDCLDYRLTTLGLPHVGE